MDMEKRKRSGVNNDGGDHVEEKMMKEKKNKMATELEDEEVEEFFAILRRIREAVKYFEKKDDNGSGRVLTAKVWKPSFQVDDFDGSDGEDEDGVKDGSGLDLNSRPAPTSRKDPDGEKRFI